MAVLELGGAKHQGEDGECRGEGEQHRHAHGLARRAGHLRQRHMAITATSTVAAAYQPTASAACTALPVMSPMASCSDGASTPWEIKETPTTARMGPATRAIKPRPTLWMTREP